MELGNPLFFFYIFFPLEIMLLRISSKRNYFPAQLAEGIGIKVTKLYTKN